MANVLKRTLRKAAEKGAKSLTKVATPFLDENFLEKESPTLEGKKTGTLQPIAASILMKVLYAARVARIDLLEAVNALATKVSTWKGARDRRLHRLMSRVQSSLSLKIKGHIGNKSDEVKNRSLQ